VQKSNTFHVGDTPDVLAQKKRNRDVVFNGFKIAAGPAYDKLAMPNRVALSPGKTDKSGTAIAATPSDEDKQAMAWLDANPNDPGAPAVLAKLKKKGLK